MAVATVVDDAVPVARTVDPFFTTRTIWPVHRTIVAIKDDIINDQRARIAELVRQNDRLISGTSTSVHIAESIHEKAYETPAEAGES